MARTSKKKIGVYDEGISLIDDVDTFDFVGAGVTATASLGDVEVNIPGGGGGLTIITLTGTIDDSNVTFTAGSEPTQLVINGGIYKPTGGAIAWTYVAGTITLSNPVGTGGSVYGLG